MWGWGRTGENNKIKFEKYHVPDSKDPVVDVGLVEHMPTRHLEQRIRNSPKSLQSEHHYMESVRSIQ